MNKRKNKAPFLLMAAGVLYAIWPFDVPGPFDDVLAVALTTLLSVLIKGSTTRLGIRMTSDACDELARQAVSKAMASKMQEDTIEPHGEEESEDKHVAKASAFN